MKPRIGITTTPTQHEGNEHDSVTRAYVSAVVAAGALPVLLPVLDPGDAEATMSFLDGLLLSGGGDVAPSLYGGEEHPEVSGVDIARDRYELALIETATALSVPILGICRGAQILNVAFGGTLVPHLPDISPVRHRDADRVHEPIHQVQVLRGSLLRATLGKKKLGVNSLHHQAVSQIGTDLRVVAWDTEGTVEGIESTGGLRALAVQWHPELLPDSEPHARLFRWLVAEAARPALPFIEAEPLAEPAMSASTMAEPAMVEMVPLVDLPVAGSDVIQLA